jgi:hypothetical protein
MDDIGKTYNHCLAYVILFQKKKTMIYQYLEELIFEFQTELTPIINMVVHDIKNIKKWKIYAKSRDSFITKFTNNLFNETRFSALDSSDLRYSKKMNIYILKKFNTEFVNILNRYLNCIKFLDNIYLDLKINMLNHYTIKGNLIQDNQIIYDNVIKEKSILINHEIDDHDKLPPKKRYRK